MPANTEPIYTLTPKVQSATPVLASAGTDGVGFVVSGGTVTHYIAFTAGSNGSYVKEARIKIATTNGTTAVAATTIRFFVSTISSGATSGSDTHLITEIAIPAITPATTSASPDFSVPLNFALETGKNILCSTGVAANANTFYKVTVFGGDY